MSSGGRGTCKLDGLGRHGGLGRGWAPPTLIAFDILLLPDCGAQALVRNDATLAPKQFGATEKHQRGHGYNIIAMYELAMRRLRDIETGNDNIAHGVLKTLDSGMHSAARTAPRSVEVDKCQSSRGYKIVEITCRHISRFRRVISKSTPNDNPAPTVTRIAPWGVARCCR